MLKKNINWIQFGYKLLAGEIFTVDLPQNAFAEHIFADGPFSLKSTELIFTDNENFVIFLVNQKYFT